MCIEQKMYVVVTDYMPNDGSRDVSDDIQRLIDENPNRTIYFPDGTYILSKPILTPAHPERSVSLSLSCYAKLKASDDWSDSEAMVRLGAKDAANDIYTVGSNYYLEGGIIDGNYRANGVSVDGGRETVVRNLSMKHTKVGLYIKYGANCGSSDCDIYNVNIVGTRTEDSVGVIVEGHDNTFTAMRIADVLVGFDIRSGGNFLRTIHPLFTLDFSHFDKSCAFYDKKGTNWFDNCYADNFCMSFREGDMDKGSVYNGCFCFWYSPKGDKHIAFKADGTFHSQLSLFKVDFNFGESKNVILEVGRDGGIGRFERLITTIPLLGDNTHEKYLNGALIEKNA